MNTGKKAIKELKEEMESLKESVVYALDGKNQFHAMSIFLEDSLRLLRKTTDDPRTKTFIDMVLDKHGDMLEEMYGNLLKDIKWEDEEDDDCEYDDQDDDEDDYSPNCDCILCTLKDAKGKK